MKKLLVLSLILIYAHVTHAQISIGNVSSTPDPSAMLEVKPSTTTNAKGFRLPNLNSNEISGITSPATGLLVADLSNNAMQYRSSSQWLTIPAFSPNAANSSTYLHRVNSSNDGISVTNFGAGTGITGTNFSPNRYSVGVFGNIAHTFGGVGASGVYGKNFTTGVNGNGVFGEHAGTGIGVLGKSNGGIGVSGQSDGVNAIGVSGSSTNGTAVFGTSTSGIAGDFESLGGTALYTNGPISLRSIGEADGRVLTTDNVGIATWQDLPKIAFMAYTNNTMYVVPFLSTQNCTFDAIDFNVGNAFSTTTDRFTAPKSGIYHFDSRINALVNTIVSGGVSTSFYYRIIIYNAGGISQNSYQSLIYPTTANNSVQYQLSIDVKMNSTDYAVVQIATTNGISVTIQPGKFTTFSGHYVCGL